MIDLVTAYEENSAAAAPPLPIRGAKCEIATDYTKKKNVIRLHLVDGSEYLLMATSQTEMVEWQKKVQYHAGRQCAPSGGANVLMY